MAARIAKEVLRDNAKLRGVHSGASMQKILEKEAKKQLLLEHQEHERHEPVISTIVMEKRPLEAANLPYLHKHPAVWNTKLWIDIELIMKRYATILTTGVVALGTIAHVAAASAE